MSRYIKVPEMLQAMKAKQANGRLKPFTIGYLLADQKRKSGGQYRIMKGALSMRGKKSGKTDQRIINIELHGTAEVRSIHIDNILYFNEQPVS